MKLLDASRPGRRFCLSTRQSLGAKSMTTSQQMLFLSEILEGRPVPEDTLVYFRARLRHRLHSAILEAFLKRSRQNGLKQSDLATRINRTRAQITRWFSSATNLTIDSISDLMVGLGMDFDAFPFTPIEKTLTPEAHQQTGDKAPDRIAGRSSSSRRRTRLPETRA